MHRRKVNFNICVYIILAIKGLHFQPDHANIVRLVHFVFVHTFEIMTLISMRIFWASEAILSLLVLSRYILGNFGYTH